MKKEIIFLILIVCLFLGTRLYQLNQTPPSLYWDEASIGYNAYSILKTGKDEWGNFLPLEFKAFGEYKLPVYIYSVVPFVAIFGLADWVVRIPSVIYFALSVILVFFLGKKLYKEPKIGLLAAFLVAISSWVFIFSRAGFEVSAGLFFYLLGIFSLLKTKEKNYYLIVSILSFIISVYSYNSFRILVPLTLVIFLLFYFKIFKKINKRFLIIAILSIVMLIIGLVPIFQSLQKGSATERLNAVGIFNPTNSKSEIGIQFVKNYLTHFSPNFLLIFGDKNQRNQQQGFGEIYWLELPLIILGIYFICKNRKKEYLLPLVLALIAPIPASFTRESPHALRSLSIVPFLALIESLGIFYIAQKIKLKYVYVLIVSLLLTSFGFYFYRFITSYNYISSIHWQYGYKQIYTNYQDKFSNYDHIIVSDQYGQPYIFALFYLKYDPQKYLVEVLDNTSIRRATSLVKSFGKYQFTNVDFYNLPSGKNLIFTSPNDKMDEIPNSSILYNMDGSIAFYVYEYIK